ncbi:glycosyltransferase [Fibrobacter sp. UWB11]|uniref:glycosyltransferase n=1 Tax=Fibrobacter sp. UWB11 TaxID=1896202 RepID=UPI0009264534|nr:glycosyltransferase [Fibrobacter sp. UWB11]SIO10412.1 Glycosyltransferase, GT2 family [Fibrobacter sp. UWB11]
MSENNCEVSVVIVCMNNTGYLFPCLDSLYSTTKKRTFETIVVAYMFSKDNLTALKDKYPQVTIIENNEIKGFSENNNLALRLAHGKYALVLNDDTYFTDALIDTLVDDIEKLPQDVAIISPTIEHINLKKNAKGKMPMDSYWRYIGSIFRINFPRSKKDLSYINGNGIFQTYNISGCVFLIKMNIFRDEGFFDEQYFFGPEDIALSTRLNKKGYKCYVDSDVKITHLQGATFGKTSVATYPAAVMGRLILICGNSLLKWFVARCCYTLVLTLTIAVYSLIEFFKKTEMQTIKKIRYKNLLSVLWTSKTPKDVFTMFYGK